MRRIHSVACIHRMWHDHLWHGSGCNANRNDMWLHVHSGRMFSHTLQMDPSLGHIANETVENQNHVCNCNKQTCAQEWCWHMRRNWTNGAKITKAYFSIIPISHTDLLFHRVLCLVAAVAAAAAAFVWFFHWCHSLQRCVNVIALCVCCGLWGCVLRVCNTCTIYL